MPGSSSKSQRTPREGWRDLSQVESNLEVTCWRGELNRAFEQTGDCWGDIEATTLDGVALDRRFDAGWGSTTGEPFTIWTRPARSDRGAAYARRERGSGSETKRHRSSGCSPVRLPILASIRGPISSPSWNSKTKSGHWSRGACDASRWSASRASRSEAARRAPAAPVCLATHSCRPECDGERFRPGFLVL